MGKKWFKPHHGGGRGHSSHDLPSCKGHCAVMGTCDASRERESSKELMNLLLVGIEELYPEEIAVDKKEKVVGSEKSLSIEEMMRAEIEELKEQKHSSQKLHSIQTGVKGIVIVKIMVKNVCPLQLIQHVFEKVKNTKQPFCRHLVRLIPLQSVFYPCEDELSSNFKALVREHIKTPESEVPSVCEQTPSLAVEGEQQTAIDYNPANTAAIQPDQPLPSLESSKEEDSGAEPEAKRLRLSTPPLADPPSAPPSSSTTLLDRFSFCVQFKARNSNSLVKSTAARIADGMLTAVGGYGNYRTPQVIISIEALKNICGICWIEKCEEYLEFNIRKYQGVYCGGEKQESRVERKGADEGEGKKEDKECDNEEAAEEVEEEGNENSEDENNEAEE